MGPCATSERLRPCAFTESEDSLGYQDSNLE
ncbi:hypothetical protein MICRO80W_140075 [Micrococcus luteus]|nr:hypothetical protein MICRO80W_140075 [Micrococcus luteus]